jgi:hypothetical protein
MARRIPVEFWVAVVSLCGTAFVSGAFAQNSAPGPKSTGDKSISGSVIQTPDLCKDRPDLEQCKPAPAPKKPNE